MKSTQVVVKGIDVENAVDVLPLNVENATTAWTWRYLVDLGLKSNVVLINKYILSMYSLLLQYPFILKIKTNSIKICQSYGRYYDGHNDTMGRSFSIRKTIFKFIAGTQFLGRESIYHYHLYMACLKAADSTFIGVHLVYQMKWKSIWIRFT